MLEFQRIQHLEVEPRWSPSKARRLRLSLSTEAPLAEAELEQWAEGWRARVDGEPTPLVRADHVYRALVLPAGDHLVELDYAPSSLRRGLWLSGLALLALIVLEARAFARRR